MLWKVLKTWRFWMWVVGLAAFGVALSFMPIDVQKALCSIYDDYIAEAVQEVIGGAASAGIVEEGAEAGATSTADKIRALICVRAVEGEAGHGQPTPARLFKAASTVLPGSFALALLLCMVLPTRANEAAERGVEFSQAPLLDSPKTVSNRDFKRILEDRRVLAIRARQLRVALSYAILSGVCTAVYPPNFTAANFWDDPQNRWHMMVLTLVSCLAGSWGSHKLARTRQEASVIATAVGCGGVFLGGLIALSISLPYRMVTPIEAVRLDMVDVARFAAVRC